MLLDSLSSNTKSTRRASFSAVAFMTAAIAVTGCSRPTIVEEIKQEQVLHVVTRNAPTTYFEGRDGATGFEYELAKMFADELGVELRLRVASNLGEVHSLLDNNYTHFAATGLSLPTELEQRFKLSPPYLEIHQKVVYRLGDGRPRSAADLLNKRILVLADSSYAETLHKLKPEYPELQWEETREHETVDLLRMIEDGEIDVTILDSNEFSAHQAYYPRVREAFDISEPRSISWVFPATRDDSLPQLAQEFFARIEQDGTLLQLQERYYGHVEQINYVGARTFIQHINNRLPRYEQTFKEAAARYDIDWRLLAAIGYQESHWMPNAVSPTGVRGLMMLTRVTAKEMGVANRLDPIASIEGGARYFSLIRERVARHIPEPDRTWLALASYNVGFGHMEDARTLTARNGLNPDKWMDVKEYLPLLQKAKWYKQTRFGYARGMEAVKYVQNIRRYYDVLVWMTRSELDPEPPLDTDITLLEASNQSHQHNVLPLSVYATPPML